MLYEGLLKVNSNAEGLHVLTNHPRSTANLGMVILKLKKIQPVAASEHCKAVGRSPLMGLSFRFSCCRDGRLKFLPQEDGSGPDTPMLFKASAPSDGNAPACT